MEGGRIGTTLETALREGDHASHGRDEVLSTSRVMTPIDCWRERIVGTLSRAPIMGIEKFLRHSRPVHRQVWNGLRWFLRSPILWSVSR